MNKIFENIDNIRDLINHPWKQNILIQDKIIWNKLCSSLDAIEDAQHSINFYDDLKDFNAHEGGYLYIYGLLQSIYVQQDAIKSLKFSLFNIEINFKIDYPDLYYIREIRNKTIGHPTSRHKDKSFHFIIQNSIGKHSIELWNYYSNNTDDHEFINISECINIQSDNISKILEEIISNLEQEFKRHKNKFNSNCLFDIFPENLSFYLEKLFEGDKDPRYKIHLNVLFEIYEKIKIGIKARYEGSIAQDRMSNLDYIFKRLNNPLLSSLDDEFHENYNLVIALENQLLDFKEIIIEIDIEFGAKSERLVKELEKRKTRMSAVDKDVNIKIILPEKEYNSDAFLSSNEPNKEPETDL